MRLTSVAVLLSSCAAFMALAPGAAAAGMSFTTLDSGFQQEVYGVAPGFMGGVAFAPDGDPWVTPCAFSGGGLRRFDTATTTGPVNGTTLHPVSSVASNAGCGLTNHPNGTMYTNTSSGVVQLHADTGAQLAGPFGTGGNALGIATDPQTNNLVYADGGGLSWVNPTLTAGGKFSSGGGYDQIVFDPSGNFVFASEGCNVTIIHRTGATTGAIAQSVSSSPRCSTDGMAFHSEAPHFVLSINTDGTITRYDFPGDDYTMAPTTSTFASGGFRGDMAQVGPDGCLYITQNGTRYDDGSTSGDNSLVRLCFGFAPPVGVAPAPQAGIAHSIGVGVVTSVSPSSGPADGGTQVIISGKNLDTATAVLFGDTPAAAFVVDGFEQITAVTPPHASGNADVQVVNPYGTSATSNSDLFGFIGPAFLAPSSQPEAVAPPKESTSGNAEPESGTVFARVPGSNQFVALRELTNLPVGTEIDARNGTVRLTVADGKGGFQTGEFSGAIFRFTQRIGGNPTRLLTDIRILGGDFKVCGPGETRSAPGGAARRRVVRYLQSKASGSFNVIGKHASGVERGTTWKTTDTCKTTEVSVSQGTVLVSDFFIRKVIRVNAGRTYIARARKRARG
jgi:hypothetical protein